MCWLLVKNYTVPTMLNSVKSKFANFYEDIKLPSPKLVPLTLIANTDYDYAFVTGRPKRLGTTPLF